MGDEGQASGTAASRIDAEGAIINSGYCSGRNDLNKVSQHSKEEIKKENEIASSGLDLEGCKGTDHSYNANADIIELAEKIDLGAFSGDSGKPRGTLDEGNKGSSQTPMDSSANKPQQQGFANVSGTRGSFNAGSLAQSKSSKQESLEDITGSKNSFNDKKIRDGAATIKAAYDALVQAVKGLTVIGTRESFNIRDQESNIEGGGANINIGTGHSAAIAELKNVKGLTEGDPLENCTGTDQSFNAFFGGEVNVSHGKLNTGAYSGNTTQEGATASPS